MMSNTVFSYIYIYVQLACEVAKQHLRFVSLMMLRVAHTHDIIGVLDMCEGKKDFGDLWSWSLVFGNWFQIVNLDFEWCSRLHVPTETSCGGCSVDAWGTHQSSLTRIRRVS